MWWWIHRWTTQATQATPWSDQYPQPLGKRWTDGTCMEEWLLTSIIYIYILYYIYVIIYYIYVYIILNIWYIVRCIYIYRYIVYIYIYIYIHIYIYTYIHIYIYNYIYPRKTAGKVNFRTLSVAFYIFFWGWVLTHTGMGQNLLPYFGDEHAYLPAIWMWASTEPFGTDYRRIFH